MCLPEKLVAASITRKPALLVETPSRPEAIRELLYPQPETSSRPGRPAVGGLARVFNGFTDSGIAIRSRRPAPPAVASPVQGLVRGVSLRIARSNSQASSSAMGQTITMQTNQPALDHVLPVASL